MSRPAQHLGAAPPPVDTGDSSPGIQQYLSVLARRKLLVILVLLIVPTVAIAYSVTQQPMYQGSAQVLLQNLNLAAGLTGIPDTTQLQPDRVAQTQASLARVPTVAERTLRAAGLHDRTVDDFLAASSVTTQINSDLLGFTVNDPNPKLASKLASIYAREYTAYRRETDTAAIQSARADIEKRINGLQKSGDAHGALYESLLANDDKLRTMEELQTSNASVVPTIQTPVKIRPRPKRTAMFGVALAVVLAIGIAFLADAVDTRIRVVDEIARRLGLPLLARLPERRRRRRLSLPGGNDDSSSILNPALVMLENPTGVEAEGYRVLRANLDFVNPDGRAQTIMVASALEGEGKSEMVANLALAFARSGRRVALVDLDLRRPTLHQLFDLSGHRGVADVAAGAVDLDDALVRVRVERGYNDHPIAGNDPHGDSAFLDVLPAGLASPDAAGEYIGTHALGEILQSLRHRTDLILVDTPAMLRVGDAMAVSTHVDALLVVVRHNAIRRPILKELRRVLDACPVPKLGFVVTHADNEIGGYGYAEPEKQDVDKDERRFSGRLAVAPEARKASE